MKSLLFATRLDGALHIPSHTYILMLTADSFIKLIAIVAITLGIIFFGLSFLITDGKFRISNLVRLFSSSSPRR